MQPIITDRETLIELYFWLKHFGISKALKNISRMTVRNSLSILKVQWKNILSISKVLRSQAARLRKYFCECFQLNFWLETRWQKHCDMATQSRTEKMSCCCFCLKIKTIQNLSATFGQFLTTLIKKELSGLMKMWHC